MCVYACVSVCVYMCVCVCVCEYVYICMFFCALWNIFSLMPQILQLVESCNFSVLVDTDSQRKSQKNIARQKNCKTHYFSNMQVLLI